MGGLNYYGDRGFKSILSGFYGFLGDIGIIGFLSDLWPDLVLMIGDLAGWTFFLAIGEIVSVTLIFADDSIRSLVFEYFFFFVFTF